MLLVKTTSKPSAIHGYGLFAAEFIEKGRAVWRFDHRIDLVIPINSFWRIGTCAREEILHYGYFNRLIERYVLSTDGARYINHSPVPNVITIYTDKDDEGIDVAAEDIEEGLELTMDYRRFDGHAGVKLKHSSWGSETELPIVPW